jgi:hypothetical protein
MFGMRTPEDLLTGYGFTCDENDAYRVWTLEIGDRTIAACLWLDSKEFQIVRGARDEEEMPSVIRVSNYDADVVEAIVKLWTKEGGENK